MLDDKARDLIRPCSLVVRGAAKCFVHNRRCYLTEIIGMDGVGVGRTRPSKGNGAPGGRAGSGERATVSSYDILFTTSDGVVIRRHVVSSLIIERSVGSVELVVVPAAVHMIDLSATSGFLKNMRRRALP